MNEITSTLNYRGQTVVAALIDGAVWLRVGQIVRSFGFADESAVRKAYQRHSAEFSSLDVRTVDTLTEGGMQEARIFSLSGIKQLSNFFRTKEAEAFRIWLKAREEGRINSGPRRPIAPLPTEAHLMLADLYRLAPPNSFIAQAIMDYQAGRRDLPENEMLASMRRERVAYAGEMKAVQRKFRDLYQRGRRLGLHPDTLHWEPPAQAALGFDGEGV